MSQSGKVTHTVGALYSKNALSFKSGSTSVLTSKSTPAHTTLADAAATLTVAQLRSGLLVITPTAARTLTLPTATLMSAFLNVVGDTLDFSVINLGADTFHVTVSAGVGGSNIGYAVVRDSDPTAAADSGSAIFRIRQTAVDTPAYVCYRIC